MIKVINKASEKPERNEIQKIIESLGYYNRNNLNVSTSSGIIETRPVLEIII